MCVAVAVWAFSSAVAAWESSRAMDSYIASPSNHQEPQPRHRQGISSSAIGSERITRRASSSDACPGGAWDFVSGCSIVVLLKPAGDQVVWRALVIVAGWFVLSSIHQLNGLNLTKLTELYVAPKSESSTSIFEPSLYPWIASRESQHR